MERLGEMPREDVLRTSYVHLKRAFRAFRFGVFRARRELVDGMSRASLELRNAAASLRAGRRSR